VYPPHPCWKVWNTTRWVEGGGGKYNNKPQRRPRVTSSRILRPLLAEFFFNSQRQNRDINILTRAYQKIYMVLEKKLVIKNFQ
jgi:hypothetical protein